LSFIGQFAKSARLAFRALLIRKEYGFSNAETASMIEENPYFQYFCGTIDYTLDEMRPIQLIERHKPRKSDNAVCGCASGQRFCPGLHVAAET